MTKSRGIRVRRGTRAEWVEANNGRYFCQCGCGAAIPLRPEHFNVGVPRFRLGHATALRTPLERVRHSAGYVWMSRPDHPCAVQGRVLEHRIVFEEHLRAVQPDSPLLEDVGGSLYLRRDVDVHHINETKDDNRLENLEAMTKGEHTALHNTGRKRG